MVHLSEDVFHIVCVYSVFFLCNMEKLQTTMTTITSEKEPPLHVFFYNNVLHFRLQYRKWPTVIPPWRKSD